MELSSFISYFHFSTVTYSVEIYTPITDIKKVYSLKVMIDGTVDERTGEHILVDPKTTPTTESRGYVIYQTLETVFYHISKHRQES